MTLVCPPMMKFSVMMRMKTAMEGILGMRVTVAQSHLGNGGVLMR